jgi:sterol desaturase/sphingolipid hydroxylase (fatty acid hydroxylase superfamily)
MGAVHTATTRAAVEPLVLCASYHSFFGEWVTKIPNDCLLQLWVIIIFLVLLIFILQLFYCEHRAFVRKYFLVYEITV